MDCVHPEVLSSVFGVGSWKEIQTEFWTYREKGSLYLYVPHGKEDACYLSILLTFNLLLSWSLHFPGSRSLLDPPSLLARGCAGRSHLGQQRERQSPPGELQSCFLSLVFRHSDPKVKDVPLGWTGTLPISCATCCCPLSSPTAQEGSRQVLLQQLPVPLG